MSAPKSRVLLLIALSITAVVGIVACGAIMVLLTARSNSPPGQILGQSQPSTQKSPEPPASGPSHAPIRTPEPPKSLDGLYIGRYPGGDKAMAYLFKPSGALAYDFYQSVVDPDEAAKWPTVQVYVEVQAEEKGYHPYRVNLGTYQLFRDRIRLNTQELYVDSALKTKFRETIGGALDQTGEELSFRALPDLSAIEIDRAVLLRQQDQTGRKLSGDFAQDGAATIRASFTPDGRFSWQFGSIYNGPGATGGGTGITVPGSDQGGTGRYQVQRNEILLQYSDGRVDRKVFADLGRDRGIQVLAIGGWVILAR